MGFAESSSMGANPPNKTVFVIHGRNEEARKALFDFLRALGLNPLEWDQAIALTGQGAPSIQEILSAAFQKARALIVLLTGDDLVSLREEYVKAGEERTEALPMLQARPNVLFEAGLAMGSYQERTIIVELGDVKPFSDIAGRHTIRMDDSKERRNALATRLESADCAVDRAGTDWLSNGQFEQAISPVPIVEAESAVQAESTVQDFVSGENDLTDDDLIALACLGRYSQDLTAKQIAACGSWGEQRALLHLQNLIDGEYIRSTYHPGEPTTYTIRHNGRTRLYEDGLLH